MIQQHSGVDPSRHITGSKRGGLDSLEVLFRSVTHRRDGDLPNAPVFFAHRLTAMENSKIEWTHHTLNPWIGCTKVSPGCLHCYAETLMDTRYGRVKWGKGQPRSRTAADNWRKPKKWNAGAVATAPQTPV